MTPRTKEQNEEIRLRRLAQIRMAAADVFLVKGPLLEIRDVSVEAGLGYGTVYHYFSNKGDLLHDLLWDALDRAGEWLKTLPEDTIRPGPPDRAALGVQLLELWAQDHAVYLLYKQAAEGFPALPEARSSPLSAAFRRELLTPLAEILGWRVEHGATAVAAATAAPTQAQLQQTEWLLAAMAGCASLPLHRGQLAEEAREIVRVLNL
ncbi:TetR/AcrR family transcriptional regulator [Paenibacillus piscarius]|uniref:TetR/AcrR family transcriptional regulator n=1 Tax=Paenibacillus piscarius TaxID=1089681 RepID=UPI001EE971FC|nr:TetR/AcrR family transcriptional regulator [Paenibacillus piscarius]